MAKSLLKTIEDAIKKKIKDVVNGLNYGLSKGIF